MFDLAGRFAVEHIQFVDALDQIDVGQIQLLAQQAPHRPAGKLSEIELIFQGAKIRCARSIRRSTSALSVTRSCDLSATIPRASSNSARTLDTAPSSMAASVTQIDTYPAPPVSDPGELNPAADVLGSGLRRFRGCGEPGDDQARAPLSELESGLAPASRRQYARLWYAVCRSPEGGFT